MKKSKETITPSSASKEILGVDGTMEGVRGMATTSPTASSARATRNNALTLSTPNSTIRNAATPRTTYNDTELVKQQQRSTSTRRDGCDGYGGPPIPRRLMDSLPPTPQKQQHKRQESNRQQLYGRKQQKKPSSSKEQTQQKPTKVVYLIRHGESKGQRASRQARRTDTTLTDCGLTTEGQQQSLHVPEILGETVMSEIELVICSPLTRAVLTASLAFGQKRRKRIQQQPATTASSHGVRENTLIVERGEVKVMMAEAAPVAEETVWMPPPPILCHYDLREVGSMIPENIPRKTEDVVDDVQRICESMDNVLPVTKKDRLDLVTLRPGQWPNRHDLPPKVVRRDRIQKAFTWLANKRPERTFAVVCHYHVIRAALRRPSIHSLGNLKTTTDIHPKNASPIACKLYPDGSLQIIEDFVEEAKEDDGSM